MSSSNPPRPAPRDNVPVGNVERRGPYRPCPRSLAGPGPHRRRPPRPGRPSSIAFAKKKTTAAAGGRCHLRIRRDPRQGIMCRSGTLSEEDHTGPAQGRSLAPAPTDVDRPALGGRAPSHSLKRKQPQPLAADVIFESAATRAKG